MATLKFKNNQTFAWRHDLRLERRARNRLLREGRKQEEKMKTLQVNNRGLFGWCNERQRVTGYHAEFCQCANRLAATRYAPNSFSDVGTYQGRSDVLGIGISSAQSSANRGGQSSTFYNTQGYGEPVLFAPGAGSVLSADLYISSSMADPGI